MKRIALGLMAVILAIPCGRARAQDQVVFDFQARVKTKGKPFNGAGLFMFTILAKDGPTEYVLWHNSGDLSNPTPDAAVPLVVIDGFASVQIGDTSLANMAPLDPVIFQHVGPLFLRVWFDDGVNGMQQLSPDQPVNNPRLIGGRAQDVIDLYVNATTGDDHNSGTSANKAKKTVSAAVDAMPPTLQQSATIHIADGVYYEAVTLRGISCSGPDAILTIVGNESTPSNVVISGAASDIDPTPVRAYCLLLENSSQIIVNGIRFTDADYPAGVDYNFGGVVAAASTNITVKNCEMANHEYSGIRMLQSQMIVDNCLIDDCDIVGVSLIFQSNIAIKNSHIEDIGNTGISLTQSSYASCANTVIERSALVGIGMRYCSSLEFGYDSVIRDSVKGVGLEGSCYARIHNSLIENCSQYGIHAYANSCVRIGAPSSAPLEIKSCNVAVFSELQSAIENALGTELILTSNTTAVQTATDGKVYAIPPS